VNDQVLPMFPLGMSSSRIRSSACASSNLAITKCSATLKPSSASHLFDRAWFDVGGFDERTSVGTLMQILGAQVLPNGQTVVMAEGVECFEVANCSRTIRIPGVVKERCCDEDSVMPHC